MTRKTTAKAATTTYLLDLGNGNKRRITVPTAWKVTFGPAVPFSGKDRGYTGSERSGYALRFYEGNKENQRAIFTDVRAFRDQSLAVEEMVTRTKHQTVRKSTEHGVKDVMVEARVTEWINPDAPASTPQEFLSLPHHTNSEEVF